MGIESDQVVYEYLSRVGDVAQQQQLGSATRMRLVSELRDEIDRRRAKTTVDSPAAVRRIISRLGSPDDVVAAAGGSAGSSGSPGSSGGSGGSGGSGSSGAGRVRGSDASVAGIPVQPVAAQQSAQAVGSASPKGESPVGLQKDGVPGPRSGSDGVPLGGFRDWWQKDPGTPDGFSGGPYGFDDEVPGFIGGVEIPELLRRPGVEKEDEGTGAAAEEAEVAPEVEAVPEPSRKRRFPLPFSGRTSGESAAGPRWTNPLLLLAAACLVAGAVLGNFLPLLAGWLIAYASRRLSDQETKWAVFYLPGSALTAGLVWLWGRTDGRWGDPIPDGQMSGAIAETWPWVVRGAAVLSALFLVWRSQRGK